MASVLSPAGGRSLVDDDMSDTGSINSGIGAGLPSLPHHDGWRRVLEDDSGSTLDLDSIEAEAWRVTDASDPVGSSLPTRPRAMDRARSAEADDGSWGGGNFAEAGQLNRVRSASPAADGEHRDAPVPHRGGDGRPGGGARRPQERTRHERRSSSSSSSSDDDDSGAPEERALGMLGSLAAGLAAGLASLIGGAATTASIGKGSGPRSVSSTRNRDSFSVPTPSENGDDGGEEDGFAPGSASGGTVRAGRGAMGDVLAGIDQGRVAGARSRTELTRVAHSAAPRRKHRRQRHREGGESHAAAPPAAGDTAGHSKGPLQGATAAGATAGHADAGLAQPTGVPVSRSLSTSSTGGDASLAHLRLGDPGLAVPNVASAAFASSGVHPLAIGGGLAWQALFDSDSTLVPAWSLLSRGWVMLMITASFTATSCIGFLWPVLGPHLLIFGLHADLGGLFFGLASVSYAISSGVVAGCFLHRCATGSMLVGVAMCAAGFFLLGPALPSLIEFNGVNQLMSMALMGSGAGMVSVSVLPTILRDPGVRRLGSGAVETGSRLTAGAAAAAEAVGPVVAGVLVTVFADSTPPQTGFSLACLFAGLGLITVFLMLCTSVLYRWGMSRGGCMCGQEEEHSLLLAPIDRSAVGGRPSRPTAHSGRHHHARAGHATTVINPEDALVMVL